MFLLANFAVTWYCYIYHHCLFLMFVKHKLVGYLSLVCQPVSGSPTGSWLGYSPPALKVSPILTERLEGQTYTQMFLYFMPATCLWCSMYAQPSCILQPAVMCWIVSEASLHVFSWSATISASVLFFSRAFSSH